MAISINHGNTISYYHTYGLGEIAFALAMRSADSYSTSFDDSERPDGMITGALSLRIFFRMRDATVICMVWYGIV